MRIDPAGDGDADGFHGIVVGLGGSDLEGSSQAGRAWVVRGDVDLSEADARLVGSDSENATTLFRLPHAHGLSDIFMGGPGDDDGGEDDGAAWLVLGASMW